MILKKNSDDLICLGLSIKEFQCSCDDCSVLLIDEDLIAAYYKLRVWNGKELHINSGYRCQSYNMGLYKASPTSQHMEGRAIDISKKTIKNVEEFITQAMYFGFNRYIIYPGFVHLDTKRKEYEV